MVEISLGLLIAICVFAGVGAIVALLALAVIASLVIGGLASIMEERKNDKRPADK